MRKWLTSTALACSIFIGGCSTVQVTNFLSQIQSATASACAFVPTIDTILAVASALGIPASGIAGAAINTIAHVICNQVPPVASARYRAIPHAGSAAGFAGDFNGIQINGWRTH